MDEKELLNNLSLEEKAHLLVGHTNMTTYPILDKGIPSFIMSDGPHGVRKENETESSIDNSIKTLPATCFPSGSTLSNTFDNDLLYKIGSQIGQECRYYGINAILGPAINIKRNPLCGRNFEYISEDPFLAGYLASNYVKGIQDQHVLACLKHYACNNLEKWRYVGDSIVDKRALNDIYLKPFEIVVRESHPGMVMTSYNKINGTFASENEYLINNRLRGKMGFDGLTVTDWGGMVHRDLSLSAGQDLEMPGMIKENVEKIINGVQSGQVKIEDVDNAVLRLLTAIKKTRVDKINDENIFIKSKEVALEAALKGAVLLKNDNSTLPLNKNKKLLVVGNLFNDMRFQGSGSSLINAKHIIDNKTAFDSSGVNYECAQGYDQMTSKVNKKLEKEALDKCLDADTILFFGGLTDLSESEGYDRPNMLLDGNQIHLLEQICELNKKVIFIAYGGSPFEIPCLDKLSAILYMCLPGECGGEALRQLLFGEVSPSGHLGQTWMKRYSDIPFFDEFIKTPNELYKESIFVGYRYYNTVNKEVEFPFGFGLTYGQYSFRNLKTKVNNDDIEVTFDVINESNIPLSVVPQIYVGNKDSSLPRPKKELKTYTRIDLKENDKQTLTLKINIADLAVYDVNRGKDVVEDGKYIIYLSDNVEHDYETAVISVHGEMIEQNDKYNFYSDLDKLPLMTKQDFEKVIDRPIEEYLFNKKPYTLETPIMEFNTFFGKIIKKTMLNMGNKIIKSAKKVKDEQERKRQIKSGTFIKSVITTNCLRSLCYSSAGVLSYNRALGLLYLANGKLFKGLKYINKK